MSMICRFVAIEAERLDELRDDAEAALDAMFEAEESGDEDRMLDIDKAWHAIHFLLNDSAYEGEGTAALVIFGGQTIAQDEPQDQEAGEMIVRYLTPSEVEDVAALLADISVEELEGRYDPDAMEQAEIYPTGVWAEERQEAFDYVAEYYEQLVEFYEAAAERGDAVLTSIG
jgi:hypothetical protein